MKTGVITKIPEHALKSIQAAKQKLDDTIESQAIPWHFTLLTFGCKVNQYESQALREAWLRFGGVEVALNLRTQKAPQLTELVLKQNTILEKNIAIAPSAPNPTPDSTKATTPAPASILPHIVLLNTCAITAEAVADVRQSVARIRRIHPRVSIVLTGCAVTAEQELARALPDVDSIVPQSEKALLVSEPWSLLDAERYPNFQAIRYLSFEDSPYTVPDIAGAIANAPNQSSTSDDSTKSTASAHKETSFPSFSISTFTRARPVLKVQDGCVQGCTYCIVPLARGRSRSRPFDAIFAEAERLLQSGAREIMLSGINLREYHMRTAPLEKKGSPSFWGMLKRLDAALAPKWEGVARFRISSLDPAQLNDEGLDTLINARLVCPHLHLSLQSGSQAVLRRMGRSHYTPERMVEAVASLAQHWPIMGLGADLLMGFAGEDQCALEESLAIVQALPLNYAHVFAYSERPGTVAASFTDHLPKAVRQDHARQMRSLVARKQAVFLENILAMQEATVNTPRLLVAPDGAGSKKGVDSYYISCKLEEGSKPFINRSLQAVYPIKVTKEGLVVKTIMA